MRMRWGADHPEIGAALDNLATLYDDEGKYIEAESFYQRAFDNLFEQFQYNFTYMTEKERLDFWTRLRRLSVYFSFVHRFRQKDPR